MIGFRKPSRDADYEHALERLELFGPRLHGQDDWEGARQQEDEDERDDREATREEAASGLRAF